MAQAVIFDLDGTLADTLGSITHYVNRTTAMLGLSSLSEKRVKSFVGNGAKLLIERVLEHLGHPELFDEAFALYNQLYNAHPYHALKEYDGITPMLETLKQKGIRTAVLSNKPHSATRPICRYLFGELVDFSQGQLPDIPIKPDPQGLNLVCEKLGVSPEDCVYVGDSEVDMLTGKNAGAFTVGVSWGFRDKTELKQNGADAIIDTPSALLSFLK